MFLLDIWVIILSATPPPYSGMIDLTLVNCPDTNIVDPTLSCAWQINEHCQMCVSFNCISPVRQFKRGMVYDKTNPNTFPEYNLSPEWDEVLKCDSMSHALSHL